MRLMMFFKLMVLSLCLSLLSFALIPDATPISALKAMALGTVVSIAATVFYPEIRGIKAGDSVAVVTDASVPSLIGRMGIASASGKRKEQIKIMLGNGNEVTGIVEDYVGLISPPKIKLIYEERLVD